MAQMLASNALIQVTPGLMIWTIIAFLITFFVLKRYAFGPIQKMLDERREQIRRSIEEAENARAARALRAERLAGALSRARQALAAGRWEEARDVLAPALDENPGNPEAVSLHAMIARRTTPPPRRLRGSGGNEGTRRVASGNAVHSSSRPSASEARI